MWGTQLVMASLVLTNRLQYIWVYLSAKDGFCAWYRRLGNHRQHPKKCKQWMLWQQNDRVIGLELFHSITPNMIKLCCLNTQHFLCQLLIPVAQESHILSTASHLPSFLVPRNQRSELHREKPKQILRCHWDSSPHLFLSRAYNAANDKGTNQETR